MQSQSMPSCLYLVFHFNKKYLGGDVFYCGSFSISRSSFDKWVLLVGRSWIANETLINCYGSSLMNYFKTFSPKKENNNSSLVCQLNTPELCPLFCTTHLPLPSVGISIVQGTPTSPSLTELVLVTKDFQLFTHFSYICGFGDC